MTHLEEYNIILASKSPRRRELLQAAGIQFKIDSKNVNESYPPVLECEQIAMHIAKKKAVPFLKELEDNDIVISADTIVWHKGEQLGKPKDAEDAFKMIRGLAGSTHEVITGVYLLSNTKDKLFYETTKVTFNALTDEQINFYINIYKPYDKAGGYGIQEWIGLQAVSHIEGCYHNVVGLPANRLIRELRLFVN